jgi:hypothetical protein
VPASASASASASAPGISHPSSPDLPPLTLTLPQGFTAHLDHRPAPSPTLAITDRIPHLIRIRPEGKKTPEITLRLSPPKTPGAPWRATVHSAPWMQIRLNKLPVGQTPKSNLPLPHGPVTLLFLRDETRIPLALDIPE